MQLDQHSIAMIISASQQCDWHTTISVQAQASSLPFPGRKGRL
jgi:hypothetical protein